MVRRTTNGGETWSNVTSGTTNSLNAVYFANSNTAFAVGAGATVRRSTDGGASWGARGGSPVAGNLYGVHFLNANNGWIVGSDGAIFRTTNGGATWTDQTVVGGTLRAVHFVNSNVGYVVVGEGNVIKTTNEGTSWNSQGGISGTGLFDFSFPDTSIGYVVGQQGIMHKVIRPTAAAAVPALSSPTHNATNIPVSTSLTWGASSGAVSYHVQLSTSNTFATTLVNDSGLTATSRAVDSLEQGTVYYWRVRAKNPVGAVSDWATTRQFTTIPAAPGVPTLVSPADNATDIPIADTLKWNPLALATSYRVQISTSNTFASTVFNDSLTATQRAFESLENDATYYWRVRAMNAGGQSDWSAVRQFATAPPTSLYPAYGSTTPASQQGLLWQEGVPLIQLDGKVFDLRGRTAPVNE